MYTPVDNFFHCRGAPGPCEQQGTVYDLEPQLKKTKNVIYIML